MIEFGSEMPGKVYRAGFSRTHLKVSLDSVEIRPAFAPGGWLAFQSVGARWSWAISSRPKAMGSAIVIDFQPMGGGRAAIAGDFVLLADEVNPVLATLRQNGIEVTAVHNHMLDDRPRAFHAHFWAVDDAAKLAGGPRAALDKLKLARN